MKKFLFAISIAAAATLGAAAIETGDMAAGLNLGVAPCLESGASVTNFGIGARFQYNVAAPVRLEANFNYWLKSKGCDVIDLAVNAHYLINLSDKLRVYPIAGVGFAHLGGGGSFDAGDLDYGDFDYDDIFDYLSRGRGGWDDIFGDIEDAADAGGTSANKFMFNVGAGIEYDITSKIAVSAEIKYQYIQYFNRLPINIGVTYRF
ncbi:MAG: outer membrane beta-barrel protein [Muribaculaceae bacterium]